MSVSLVLLPGKGILLAPTGALYAIVCHSRSTAAATFWEFHSSLSHRIKKVDIVFVGPPSLIKAFTNCENGNKARNSAMVPRDGVEVGSDKGGGWCEECLALQAPILLWFVCPGKLWGEGWADSCLHPPCDAARSGDPGPRGSPAGPRGSLCPP